MIRSISLRRILVNFIYGSHLQAMDVFKVDVVFLSFLKLIHLIPTSLVDVIQRSSHLLHILATRFDGTCELRSKPQI